jgi:hypothetical protein
MVIFISGAAESGYNSARYFFKPEGERHGEKSGSGLDG